MKNIRHNVFETNSSSTHSISISHNSNGIYNTIIPDDKGIIILTGGEFGWEEETYYDSLTKANYAAVDTINKLDYQKMLIKVIKDHTGAKEVKLRINTNYRKGDTSYIDHQSEGTSFEAFSSEQTLKDFIFNPNSILQTDNDNH